MKKWIFAMTCLLGCFALRAQEPAADGQEPGEDRISVDRLSPEVAAASGERSEWLPSFTGVHVVGPVKIRFVPAPADQGPRIVYDTKGIFTSKFKATVNKDKVLIISEKYDAKRQSVTEVTLYYNTLRSARFDGADVTVEQPFEATMFDLYISGGAVVTAAFDVQDLYLQLTGKSTLTLTGRARYLSVEASTGKLDASALDVTAATVMATHKAGVLLDVDERIEATASTGAKIRYRGAPPVLRGTTSIFGGEILSVE